MGFKFNKINKETIKQIGLYGILAFFILGGLLIIWTTTISLPDLNNFEERRVAQTTKIYDKTGEIVLYDVFSEFKRTIVPLDEISLQAQQATIAVEDQDFYEHGGIQISAIFRAIINNLKAGNLLGGQGGSTITQQVIKNSLLTREKKLSRKLKEWVLAPRLERVFSKDEILEIYLNEIPYGGSVYGIQEASRRFFGKDAIDLDLVESAYLAALPQAPTYYSPYGNNVGDLEIRKNYVLDQMYDSEYITEKERDDAKSVDISFEKQESFGIKAPHFVIYIREQLEQEYGKELLEEGGLKVITTLDWELQKKAEEIVKRYALINVETNNAENGSLVATDPKTGDILVMVGSRDYFDEEIDGNFNIATAERQPGSAFKPFVYANAFSKGYRPETIVFDLSTEFSTTCENGGDCYRPGNYDNKYRGPMTLRDALAQSVNIPAVKVLYMAGLRDSLKLAKKMGIETLTNEGQYGLTLVLGGGEVRPLDMASAYGVFATEGIKVNIHGIQKIEKDGEIIFENEIVEERILSEQTARLISDILSDEEARAPAFGTGSPLYFGGRDVAAKTGTTNDYRDAWIVGYTPNISVAAWVGNNDNTPMVKKVAGFVVAPMWNEFMQIALEEMKHENFNPPDPIDPELKPILSGFWKGEQTEVIDKNTNKPATSSTADEDKVIVISGGIEGIHSILYYVNKNDPLGPALSNPNLDSQYHLWEESVQSWINSQGISSNFKLTDVSNIKSTSVTITSPSNNSSLSGDSKLSVSVNIDSDVRIVSGEIFLNGELIGQLESFLELNLNEYSSIQVKNNLKVTIVDETGNKYSDEIEFTID